VIAAYTSAVGRCLFKSIVATEVSTGQVRICAANAIVVTAMLEHSIRVLFAGTLKLAMTHYENLLRAGWGKYSGDRERYPTEQGQATKDKPMHGIPQRSVRM
jgi:hypothetical protein